MAFNAANLSTSMRVEHPGGVVKVFAYSTGDSKNDTLGSTYFDERFFAGGEIVEVAYSGGSYVGIYTAPGTGLTEI